MIHVDPASPAFERLKPREQAYILHHMGWSIEALIDEFEVELQTVKRWLNPEAYARAQARKNAYKRTPEGRAKDAEYQRRYRASPKGRAMVAKVNARARAEYAARRQKRGETK